MTSQKNNPQFPLPELLIPAGSKDKALTAFLYGADAVYVGVPMFSLRTRENNVTEDDIRDIIEYARKNNKKVYVTVNGFPHEFAIEQIKKHLTFLEEVKPDGMIFADIGVLALGREFCPSVAKHLSVQTSTVNIPAMKMWMEMGVERVILAREMAIREVKKVHDALPDLELEYFVHGAVCMAYSGRCLLSNFTGGRDANRGACNHTCRWNYRVFDEEGRVIDVSDHEDTSASVGNQKELNSKNSEEKKNVKQTIPFEFFLKNIGNILTNVTKENFYEGDEKFMIGKLPNIVAKNLDIRPEIYLSNRLYGKIRGWWKNRDGHSDITESDFYFLAVLLSHPAITLIDTKSHDRVIILNNDQHSFIVVLDDRNGYTEILSFFCIRKVGEKNEYLNNSARYKNMTLEGLPDPSCISQILREEFSRLVGRFPSRQGQMYEDIISFFTENQIIISNKELNSNNFEEKSECCGSGKCHDEIKDEKINKPIIFFDFDGVIWDSSERLFEDLKNVAKKKDKDFTTDDFADLWYGNFWEEYLKKGYTKEDRNFKIDDSLGIVSTIFSGAKEFLENISKKFDCRIISSNRTSRIEKILKTNNLDNYFSEILGFDIPGNKKEKFEKFFTENPKEKILFVTDTVGDVREASSFDKIKTIGITWGIHGGREFQKEKVEYIADSFKKLERFIVKTQNKNGSAKSLRDFEELNFWEEEQRKEEIIPVEEDFHGTHIMSSKDMCMIEDMGKIHQAGVVSLKVEGRNKTAYYAATIARAYRRALDDYAEGKEFNPEIWEEIHATANRGFFPGFLNGKPRKGSIKYAANSSTAKKEFCGRVTGWENGRLEVNIKNKILEGGEIEVVMPRIEDDFIIIAKGMMFGGKNVDELHGGNINKIATLECEIEIPVGTFLRQKARNAGIVMSKIDEAAASYKA